MGYVEAVCISTQKGTPKQAVSEALAIEGHGLRGDAHAGSGHRQVSLLAHEDICAFREKVPEVDVGSFGENIATRGVNLSAIPVGTIIQAGEALLEVTQIGKECIHPCSIMKQVGSCIFPHRGIFAKVTRTGIIKKDVELSFCE